VKRFLICASPVIGVVLGLMAVLALKQQPPAEAMPTNSQFVAPANNEAGSSHRADERTAKTPGGDQRTGPAVATHN
jgi:hypothetical protein